MQTSRYVRSLARLALIAAFLVPLAACATGISQSDYEAVKEQLTTQEKKVQALQQQLSQSQAVGGSGGVGIVLGAVAGEPPAPKPTPTPLPEGVPSPTPPPKPALPESYSEQVPVHIYADTVIGSGSKYGVEPQVGETRSSCVLTGIFARGMRIVWRFEAIDASTGKRLADADVQSAVVHLPNGEDIQARFGRHGSTDDAPWFWAAAWDIPLDFPLGTLDWSVEVKTNDGKVGTFRQLQVFSDTTDSRTQIVE